MPEEGAAGVLRPIGGATLQDLVGVLDRLSAAGIRNIVLAERAVDIGEPGRRTPPESVVPMARAGGGDPHNPGRRFEPQRQSEPARQAAPASESAAASASGGWDALRPSAVPAGTGGTARAGAPSAAELASARQA